MTTMRIILKGNSDRGLEVDLSTKLGQLELPAPSLSASGCAASGKELSQFMNLDDIGAIVTKSILLEPRSGRATPRMAETPSGMLNSIGLQGPGIDQFIENDLKWLEKNQVRTIVSIAGNNAEEFGRVAGKLRKVGDNVVGIEVNISCPNVANRGLVFACQPESAHEVISIVRRTIGGSYPIFAKLSPDVTDIVSITKAVVDAGASGVSVINTLLGMVIDTQLMKPAADQYKELVNGRTRLVSVTAASNVLGTKPDIATIAEIAHSAGALLYVDGVHSTPHFPIDINAFGADFYVSSSYKWQGPHLSGLAADPELLHRLSPYKLDSSTTESPRKYELGTPPFADLAGLTAAVDHVASADPSATGSRRERVLTSMTAVAEYQNIEAKRMIKSLREMPKVTLYSNLPDKTPTAYFTVAGYSPEQVAMALDKAGVNVWNGHNYAYEVTAALGIRDAGSAVRAGLSLYNNRQDVDRLLEVIEKL